MTDNTPTVRLCVAGPLACFTRPEFKVERMSYDVITPSAARGILEAIYWKPEFSWIIDKITVLNAIQFTSIRTNEIGSVIPMRNVEGAMRRGQDLPFICANETRQQRLSTVLTNVAYIIEAHALKRNRPNNLEPIEKHYEIFQRRAKNGQCFHQPCLGIREYIADFELWTSPSPSCSTTLNGVINLNWMLYDRDYTTNNPIFYRPIMDNGIIDVKKFRPEGVME